MSHLLLLICLSTSLLISGLTIDLATSQPSQIQAGLDLESPGPTLTLNGVVQSNPSTTRAGTYRNVPRISYQATSANPSYGMDANRVPARCQQDARKFPRLRGLLSSNPYTWDDPGAWSLSLSVSKCCTNDNHIN
eukprot:jgi/Botrbrau1/9320/Bobra.0086s0005.1